MKTLEEINNRGTTVVMATHNKEIVNTMKKRVIAIEDGIIVRDESRGSMVLMIKILGRHLRESFKSLGRNTWMTFASISAVTVTLILVGVFLVIMLNLNNMAKNAEKEVEIKVLIDLTSNKKTQDTLQNEIKDISGIKA